MDDSISIKEVRLKELLLGYGSVAVAFSGGVDSTLLLDVAHEVCGRDVVAFTACMASLASRDLRNAQSFCRESGIRHEELPFDEFAVDGFAANPPDRCYLCKRALLTALLARTKELGLARLIDGSNLDDDNDYRPGTRALRELGIASPLREAGLTKADVRTISQKRCLVTWDKPACACLSTRLPTGATITREVLERIDTAEQIVLNAGAQQVRVRVHDDLARIEVDLQSLPTLLAPKTWSHLDSELRALGFKQVTIDPEGYRMGSMNWHVPRGRE